MKKTLDESIIVDVQEELELNILPFWMKRGL